MYELRADAFPECTLWVLRLPAPNPVLPAPNPVKISSKANETAQSLSKRKEVVYTRGDKSASKKIRQNPQTTGSRRREKKNMAISVPVSSLPVVGHMSVLALLLVAGPLLSAGQVDAPAKCKPCQEPCATCPDLGCKKCPLFEEGQNPVFLKRQEEIKEKRRIKAEQRAKEEAEEEARKAQEDAEFEAQMALEERGPEGPGRDGIGECSDDARAKCSDECERRRSLAAIADEASWSREWIDRLDCWWVATPFQVFFAHRTHFSHMSHPTFPISHILMPLHSRRV